jgi:hypothetical protein
MCVCFLLLAYFHPGIILAQSDGTETIIVKVKDVPKTETILSIVHSAANTTFSGGLPSSSYILMHTSGNQDETIRMLKTNPNVLQAFKSPKVKSFGVTINDPQFLSQWALAAAGFVNSNGVTVWDKIPNLVNSTNQVKVAVIDSGIDRNHEDITGKVINSDWVKCDTTKCEQNDAGIDDLGHGTHVAGIIGAISGNGKGIVGTGWNVKLMSLKVLDSQGNGNVDSALFALNWAVDHGAKVINFSLGTTEPMDQDQVDFFNYYTNLAWSKGAVVVAAAGNCGSATFCTSANINIKSYPAAADHVISVAALDSNDNLAQYSQHNDTKTGNWISVAAPGGFCSSSQNSSCILSAWSHNGVGNECYGTAPAGYCYLAGTSQASPHVAGLAALLFAAKSDITNTRVKDIIESTAVKTVAVPGTNFGAINAIAAVDAVNSVSSTFTPTPTISASRTPTPTLSVTPTRTPTPTLSVTPTRTPTPILSVTPTRTPTPIVFLTVTRTPTPFVSVTRSPTVTGIRTPTPTLYISATLTPIPTVFSPPSETPTTEVTLPVALSPTIADCPIPLEKKYGNANNDCAIDESDLNIWITEYQSYEIRAMADFNSDGTVDLVDFEIWRRNFYYPPIGSN